MFRIKVCGVTTPEDAETAVRLGADAVGINFFPGSARYVRPAAAAAIVEAVGANAVPVAVFVNEPADRMEAVCRALGIGSVQLSGHEPPSEAGRVRLWRLKAIHVGADADPEAFLGYPCEAFLLDAGVPGAYGGTGNPVAWEVLRGGQWERLLRDADHPEGGEGKPWILAGGLTPENVREAIRVARPFGVDVASGVEAGPGRKDPEKVERFIRNAKEEFGIG